MENYFGNISENFDALDHDLADSIDWSDPKPNPWIVLAIAVAAIAWLWWSR